MNILKTTGYTISHSRFSVFYCVISYALFNFINYSKFAKWFNLNGGTDYRGLLAFFAIGLLLFIFVFLLLAHRHTTRFFAILFVILGASASYFINKYDVAVDRTMLMNAIYTDRSEVHSLLSWQMLPFVLLLMVVPIVVILRLKLTFEKNYFIASLKFIVIALVLSVGLAYSCFQNISRAANVSNKQIVHTLVPINYLQSFGSIVQHALEPYFSARKKNIVVSGQVTKPRNLIVVLAIGESARQDNFSLYGYKRRDTNPLLAKVSDLHALNGKARLGSTLYALPEILTKDDVALPALTAKIGIDTACYVNFTLYDNCIAPGEVAVTNCGHGGNCYDEDVIPLLENRLKSYVSGYNFTVLHLGGGSHGPSYQERIPAEYTEFKPTCRDADVVNKCSVEQLYNSYDNTLLYTDHVLASLIQKLDESTLPYVFIYLSDHGESLLEEGRIFHGMPPGMKLPPEQARIPLLIKSSVPLNIQQRSEYPQTDMFDSILELLSVKSEIHDASRPFLSHADAAPTAAPAPH
jgi:lipid A ethanolaminephosphotransferase